MLQINKEDDLFCGCIMMKLDEDDDDVVGLMIKAIPSSSTTRSMWVSFHLNKLVTCQLTFAECSLTFILSMLVGT